jgi:hypothetical protein
MTARDPVNLLGQALAHPNEAMKIIQSLRLTRGARGSRTTQGVR